MKISVLGAASEVGRSGFLVNCDGTNLLLDYGVMFAKKRTDPPIYPLHVKPRDVDATIITHAHLDHSGCCLLYTSPSPRDVEESRMPSSA